MIANANSPEPEFPQPSEQCLFCKKEGVKGGGVGFVICDLFRYEFMQYKTVQFDEYSMCFKCGSVLNYVVYIKRLLLTTLFGLPLGPPIFTRELPEMSMNINENVRFILHSNMQNEIEFPVPNGRKNGLRLSPHISIQEPIEQGHISNSPLLLVTHSTDEEPANVGYHDYSDDGVHVRRTRSASKQSNRFETVQPKRPQSEPRTRTRKSDISPDRPKSQITRRASQTNPHICKWLNCRLVCQSANKLMIHSDEYHKFRCLQCKEASYQTRSQLLQHKKQVHHNECKMCKLKIAPDKIWAHRRSSHNCNCPYCSLKFHHHRDVTVHIMAEHKKRRMLEWTYSKEIVDDTDLNSASTFAEKRETEIIFLNNNNNNNKAQIPTTSPKSNFLNVVTKPSSNTTNISDPLKEVVTIIEEISNTALIDAQQNTDELNSTKSGVENEKSESAVADSSITTEDQPNITSEITNESVETTATSAKTTENFSLDTRLDSDVPCSSDSSNTAALVTPKTNQRLRKRSSTAVVEYDKLPQQSTADIKLSATLSPKQNNNDTLDKPHQDKNDESPHQSNRRMRKRKVLALYKVNTSHKPSSPSKMNTRSRSRRKIAVNDQNSSETNDMTKMQQNETLIQEEKLVRNKDENHAKITDDKESSQIPKKRKKRFESNTDKLKGDVTPNEKIIDNQHSVVAEKEAVVINEPSAASETLKKTLDPVDRENKNDSIDFNNKETNNRDNPLPVIKTMSTAASKKLYLSDETIKSANSSIISMELDNKLTSANAEQLECIKSSNELDANVKQKLTDSDSNKVAVVESHESGDSLSPWYIHEEGFSCGEISPEATTNDASNDAIESTKNETHASSKYNVILLNLDKVIESVVMAGDACKSCVENSPSRKMAKSTAKNAKSDKLSSISKPKKFAIEKFNKHADVSIESADFTVETKAATSSDDVSSIQNPDDQISAKYGKTPGSTMKSVAKYMLATTAPNIKIKSTDFSLSNTTEDLYQADATLTKPVVNKTTNIANVSVGVLSVGICKTNRRARNSIQKERSHRRATTFADFTGNIHCAPAEVPSIESLADIKTIAKQISSERIPKQDVYLFPEVDNTEPSSSSRNINVELKNTDTMGMSKKALKAKRNPENVEADQYGPFKNKRVKSKPKRNTAFDNAINEASQLYLRK